MERFAWLSFYQPEHQPTWEFGSSIYFRHTPYKFAVFVLILMSVLNSINQLYLDTHRVQELTLKCYEGLRNEYTTSVYFYVRVKNFLSILVIYAAMVVLLYFLGKVQTNVFTSLLFVINIILLAWFAKGDVKASTINHLLSVSRYLKVASSFVLLLEIFFICFVGEVEKPNQPHSLDQKLKRASPFFYENLGLIGFRIVTSGDEERTPEDLRAFQ